MIADQDCSHVGAGFGNHQHSDKRNRVKSWRELYLNFI